MIYDQLSVSHVTGLFLIKLTGTQVRHLTVRNL